MIAAQKPLNSLATNVRKGSIAPVPSSVENVGLSVAIGVDCSLPLNPSKPLCRGTRSLNP